MLDVRRKFPANAPDDRDEIEIVDDRSIAQFGESIAPRLRSLAARTGAPVLPAGVLAVWGVAPRS